MKHSDNNLIEKLNRGDTVYGVWNTLRSSLVTDVLAKSGLDFVIIDFEHGPFDIDRTSDYVNACLAHDCTPIIRIPKNDSWMSLQVLDQGAHGIMLPGVSSKNEAQIFLDQVKYEPLGLRGFSPYTKAGGYNNDPNYKDKANDLITSIPIIENKKGLNNLDEILEIDSIDIIYFGAYDLSQDLGFSGDVYNDNIVSLIKQSVDKVLNAGKYAGGFVPQTLDEIKMVKDLGINFITVNVDSNIIYQSIKNIIDSL